MCINIQQDRSYEGPLSKTINFKNVRIYRVYSFNHTRIKVEIRNKRISRKYPIIKKLKYTSKPMAKKKKEITREIRKYFNG